MMISLTYPTKILAADQFGRFVITQLNPFSPSHCGVVLLWFLREYALILYYLSYDPQKSFALKKEI